MRVVCLSIFTFLLPGAALAQADFQAGSYILENDSHVRHNGLIREGNKNLRVKVAPDKVLAYPWQQVRSYQIGATRYVRASGFSIDTGFSTRVANNDFVELLDSGAVSLLRFVYAGSGPNSTPTPPIYLLRRASEPEATAIPYSVFDGGGKKLREAIAPFVASRPDLTQVLAAKKITVYNLETFIHAFNHKAPFLNYPMEGGQSNP